MFESLVQTNSGRALVSLTFPQGPTCQLTSQVFWDMVRTVCLGERPIRVNLLPKTGNC